MKKTKAVVMATLALSVVMASPSFAGEWICDTSKPANSQGISNWWYQNMDGSYAKDCWTWLDGNQDGISECYYFDGNGYMLANTVTPDGYLVNGDGAWTVDGVVQTKGQQANVSYEEVLKAYLNYLGTVSVGDYEKIRYDLVYLNNDNIPELMYALNTSHARGVDICTYQNGKVYSLSEHGSYGSITYYPKKGYIWEEDMHMGYETEVMEVMQGVTMQEVYFFSYNDPEASMTTTTEYDEFRLNGVSSTKSEIMKYKRQLLGSLGSPSTFSYDDAIEFR